MAVTHQTAKTEFVTGGAENVTYAYRRLNPSNSSKTPLVMLIHFRGTMDFWDPLLINTLAASRPVILLDNAGVGQSSGSVPPSLPAMAAHVVTFLSLLKITQIDLLGFSIGGLYAPLVALNGPTGLVRRLVLAGTGISAGAGVITHTEERAAEVTALATVPHVDYTQFSQLFFHPSPTSQQAGHEWWARVHERSKATSGEERSELVSTGYVDGGEGMKAMGVGSGRFADVAFRAEGTYDRLGELKMEVLVAQGLDDFMIPSANSFLLQQKLPKAWLKMYPDSGHGFLYQYAEDFGAEVGRFLDA